MKFYMKAKEIMGFNVMFWNRQMKTNRCFGTDKWKQIDVLAQTNENK